MFVVVGAGPCLALLVGPAWLFYLFPFSLLAFAFSVSVGGNRGCGWGNVSRLLLSCC